MKGKISLPGLMLGVLTALAAGLLVRHDSFAWLLIGIAVGMVMIVVVMRRGQNEADLRKGERQ